MNPMRHWWQQMPDGNPLTTWTSSDWQCNPSPHWEGYSPRKILDGTMCGLLLLLLLLPKALHCIP